MGHYSSRQDDRRNRQEWQQRAYFDEGVSCDNFVWFHDSLRKWARDEASFFDESSMMSMSM
jgi:hypothetical protein